MSKQLFFLMLGIALFNATQASAQTQVLPFGAEKVSSGQLDIIGRGIENKKTKEVIALACVGPILPHSLNHSCKELRHVIYQPAKQETFYIGDTYHLMTKGEPTLAELITLLKDTNSKAKAYKKESNGAKRQKWFMLAAATSGAAFVVQSDRVYNPVKQKHGELAAIAALTLTTAVYVGSLFAVQAFMENHLFTESGTLSTVMADQQGWNWAEAPKIVTHARFNWFTRYLIALGRTH